MSPSRTPTVCRGDGSCLIQDHRAAFGRHHAVCPRQSHLVVSVAAFPGHRAAGLAGGGGRSARAWAGPNAPRRGPWLQRIDDLGRLTDAVLPDGPVVVVAHDWGGPIALGWAQAHRDRVARIVLANTAVAQPPDAAPPVADPAGPVRARCANSSARPRRPSSGPPRRCRARRSTARSGTPSPIRTRAPAAAGRWPTSWPTSRSKSIIRVEPPSMRWRPAVPNWPTSRRCCSGAPATRSSPRAIWKTCSTGCRTPTSNGARRPRIWSPRTSPVPPNWSGTGWRTEPTTVGRAAAHRTPVGRAGRPLGRSGDCGRRARPAVRRRPSRSPSCIVGSGTWPSV